MLTQSTGVIVGALSFRNEFNGHTTIDSSSDQYQRLTGKRGKTVVADRGRYRGRTKVHETDIKTPKSASPKLNKYQKDKIRKQFKRRATIEPIIGGI